MRDLVKRLARRSLVAPGAVVLAVCAALLISRAGEPPAAQAQQPPQCAVQVIAVGACLPVPFPQAQQIFLPVESPRPLAGQDVGTMPVRLCSPDGSQCVSLLLSGGSNTQPVIVSITTPPPTPSPTP